MLTTCDSPAPFNVVRNQIGWLGHTPIGLVGTPFWRLRQSLLPMSELYRNTTHVVDPFGLPMAASATCERKCISRSRPPTTSLLRWVSRSLPQPTGEQRRDLLDVVDDRRQRGSTIITSQVPIGNWHEVIADPTIAGYRSSGCSDAGGACSSTKLGAVTLAPYKYDAAGLNRRSSAADDRVAVPRRSSGSHDVPQAPGPLRVEN